MPQTKLASPEDELAKYAVKPEEDELAQYAVKPEAKAAPDEPPKKSDSPVGGFTGRVIEQGKGFLGTFTRPKGTGEEVSYDVAGPGGLMLYRTGKGMYESTKRTAEQAAEDFANKRYGKGVFHALQTNPMSPIASFTPAGQYAETAVQGQPKRALGMMAGDAAVMAVMGGISRAAKPLLGPFLEEGPTPPTKVEPAGAFFPEEGAIPATEAQLAENIVKGGKGLVQMADAEAGIQDSVTKAPSAIRKGVINKAYSQVTGDDVDLVPVSEKAAESMGKLQGNAAPGATNRLLGLNKSIKAAEAELADLDPATADPEELAQAQSSLDKLKNGGKVPIQEAIQLRSALSKILATSKRSSMPSLAPGEVWQAVKATKIELDGAINKAAKNPGALKQADALHHQFMEDFYNTNAPLKGIINLKPGMVGRTLRNLTRPANINRAEDALRRWGMTDQADALRKIADTPELTGKIKDMEDLLRSPGSYGEEKMTAAKEADVKRLSAVDKRNLALRKKVSAAEEEAAKVNKEAQTKYKADKKALQDARTNRLKALGIGGGVAGYLYKTFFGDKAVPRQR